MNLPTYTRPEISQTLISPRKRLVGKVLAQLIHQQRPLALRKTQILRGYDKYYLVVDIEPGVATPGHVVLQPCTKLGVTTSPYLQVQRLSSIKSPLWGIHRADQRGLCQRTYDRFLAPRMGFLIVAVGTVVFWGIVVWIVKH